MITTQVNIKLIDSVDEAPKYGADTQILRITHALVIKRGMTSGLPSMDLQLQDAEGNKFVVMTAGTVIEAIGKAAEGTRIATSTN